MTAILGLLHKSFSEVLRFSPNLVKFAPKDPFWGEKPSFEAHTLPRLALTGKKPFIQINYATRVPKDCN
jgi:hypothetical protein